jgi:hypothetical protein
MCIENGEKIGRPKSDEFKALTRIIAEVKDILRTFKMQIRSVSNPMMDFKGINFW